MSLRAFVVEPFKIPSGSMLPTLQIGDHILVNKRSYGWEMPFTSKSIVRFGEPERGDVAVFRYPDDPGLHYVMRVIALPGDTITYANKRLSVNGRELLQSKSGVELVVDSQGTRLSLTRYQETLGKVPHEIFVDPSTPFYHPSGVRAFKGREHCRYEEHSFECRLPPDSYFVMGDNRDNSSDSRYWGFVPRENFVGPAFLIWYSAKTPDRAGAAVH